jgi:hypothetical protein
MSIDAHAENVEFALKIKMKALEHQNIAMSISEIRSCNFLEQRASRYLYVLRLGVTRITL